MIQRGNNRVVCSHAEGDDRRYRDDLPEQFKRYGYTVHAYVQMTLNSVFSVAELSLGG